MTFMIEPLRINHKGPSMSASPRAAIHLALPPLADRLKACVARAQMLGCRIVAITDDKALHHVAADTVLDRLVEGEFDLIILRAGVSVDPVKS